MKVILTKEVQNTGHAHEVVDVADGHAINFLIPRKLAVRATPAAVRDAEAHRAKAAIDQKVQEQLLAQNLETLAQANVVITMKTNDKGHLYDAVGVSEIIKAVKDQTSVELPQEAIRIEHPFKDVGTHEVPVSQGEHFGKFSIVIEAEV